MTPLCAEYWLQSGSAMGLRTGFDFSRSSCKKRAWAVLESESPFLVVLSPPCTIWSSLRNLSNHKRDPEVLRKGGKDALTHFELSAKIARWQHERGVFSFSDSQRLLAAGSSLAWSFFVTWTASFWSRLICASSV